MGWPQVSTFDLGYMGFRFGLYGFRAAGSFRRSSQGYGRDGLPYIKKPDLLEAITRFKSKGDEAGAFHFLCQISAARCARISYKPFDGDASYDREIERYNMLVSADRVHASPLEHQATPDRFDPDYPNTNTWENPDMHGNFTGWIQARKLVPNEAY
nr:hypothetical protein [Yoonia sp.]